MPEESKRPPEWQGPRVVDPDGECLWLAVDTYATEEAALAEARNGDDEAFAKVFGTVRFRLRWLDLDDEDDRYSHEEWGADTTVETDDDGREFWLIVLSPESPYIPKEAADAA